MPPFESPEAHRDFRRALGDHLYWLAHRAGRLDPATYALLGALQAKTMPLPNRRTRSVLRRNDEKYGALPDLWVLQVAICTYFPAPWSPWGLAQTLAQVDPPVGRSWVIEDRRIGVFDGEVAEWAVRNGLGRWQTYRRDRSQESADHLLASDDDMVIYLMAEYRPTHPYPLGWAVDDDVRNRELNDRAQPILAAWEEHTRWPYIADEFGGSPPDPAED